MSDSTLSSDGSQISWSVDGTGPALVVIDPIMVDRTLSPNGPLSAELADSFTVIRYDRRGKGESRQVGPITPEAEVADLSAVIDAASPAVPPAVYGMSSGGSLALLAAGHGVPMSALVVLEPPSNLPDVEGIIARTEALVADGQDLEAVRAFWTYQGIPDEITAQMADLADACAPYAGTIPADLNITQLLTPALLARCDVPVLAVASQASPPPLQEFARFAAAHAPHGELRTLAGDWHGVPDDVLAAAIGTFVSTVS